MRERWDQRAQEDAFRYIETTLWDGDVDAFFAIGENRTRWLVDPALESLTVAPTEARALDVGCGVGRFTRAFAGRFESVVGIDVSEEMIRRANELHPPGDYPNVTFRMGDGVTISEGDKSFDFVFSYEVFQHLPSRDVIRANLREIARVLRPQGLALLHVHTAPSRRSHLVERAAHAVPDWLWSWAKRVLQRREGLTSDSTFRGTPPFSAREIASAWEASGLSVLDVHADPTDKLGTRAFVLSKRAG